MSPEARRLLAGMSDDELQAELGGALGGPPEHGGPRGVVMWVCPYGQHHVLSADNKWIACDRCERTNRAETTSDTGAVAAIPEAAAAPATARADHWGCIGACVVTGGACPAVTPRARKPWLLRLLDRIGRPA